MNTIEQQRFTKYQEIYQSKAPEPPPVQQAQPSFGTAASTTAMSTRRNNYGKTGLSPAGKQNIQNGKQTGQGGQRR
jgi:hypothetical protein